MNKAKQVRQIRILGILLLGVLATALAVFVIGPRFTEPNAVQEQAVKAVSEKAILDVRYIVLGQKAASIDSAKAELDAASRKYLSNRTQFPLLTGQIYQAAAAVGIPTEKVFDPTVDLVATAADGSAAAPTAGNAVPVTVKFSAEANFPTLIQFMKALGKMDYLLVIEAAQIAVPQGTAPGNFTLNVTARAYMLPPVNTSGPATTSPTVPGATPAPTQSPAVTPSN